MEKEEKRFVDLLKSSQLIIKDTQTGELFTAQDIEELLNKSLCHCHNRLVQKKNRVSDDTDMIIINDNGYLTNHYIKKEE